MPVSAYDQDPRVEWFRGDASSNVVAGLPDADHGGGGRIVMAVDQGFVVRGVVNDKLSIRHGWNQLKVFVSADDALRAVLDDPITAKIA